MTTANPDNDPALLEPHGKAWLDAAKRGDVHAMQPLLAAARRRPSFAAWRGLADRDVVHSPAGWLDGGSRPYDRAMRLHTHFDRHDDNEEASAFL